VCSSDLGSRDQNFFSEDKVVTSVAFSLICRTYDSYIRCGEDDDDDVRVQMGIILLIAHERFAFGRPLFTRYPGPPSGL